MHRKLLDSGHAPPPVPGKATEQAPHDGLAIGSLGILLGICHEAGIEVSGFVNAAVAALSTTSCPTEVTYLDLFVGHTLISELTVNSEVRHERSFEVRDSAFASLVEGWVNLLADRFVQETRFDPLHTADTEQQLYNQVYDWVNGAHLRNEVAFEVRHGEQQRRVEVTRPQLEAKAQQRIDRLIDALPARKDIVLSARAARLPGLSRRLQSAGFQVTALAGDAVAAGCNEHLALVRTVDSELRLVSRLPHEHAVSTSQDRSVPSPTHLLYEHRAQAFGSPDCPVAVRMNEDGPWVVAHPGMTLNGQPLAADERLGLGDVITVGTARYTAIRLEG